MKMPSPRHRWLLLIACLALLVVGLLCWPQTRGRFTREQYERVRLGMSLPEVEQTLGARPGHYNLTTQYWQKEKLAELEPPAIYGEAAEDRNSRWCTWDGDGGAIQVWIVLGKVVSKSYVVPVHPAKAKAREWLRRLRGLVGL
jgi:hypothetical protein